MITKIYQALAIVLLLSVAPARAAITCSIGSPGFNALYDFITTTPNDNMSSFTINCLRLATDAPTLNYIAFTDDGIYNLGNGANNRAKLTTALQYLKYDFFTDATFATNWSKSSRCIIGSINFGSALMASQTKNYYTRLPAGQASQLGSYVDTVTVYASYGATTCANNATPNISGSFTVAISNVPACEISVPPGNVAFNYTAFQATAAAANTTFSARCTTGLPYRMELNGTPTSGVYPGIVSGLNYGLSIGTTAGGAAILPTTSFTGNSAVLPYFINGNMPANQAGSCANATCTLGDPRTLTFTF